MINNKKKAHGQDIDEMIHTLKKADAENAKLAKNMQYLYFSLTIFYVFYMFFLFFRNNYAINYLIGGGFFLITFTIFMLFFKKSSAENSQINYAMPVLSLLKAAAKRYKILHPKIVWIFLGILFTALGIYFLSVDYKFVTEIQFLYWGLVVLSLIIGLIVYYVKYKPIHDNLVQMIKEIEEGKNH